MNNSEQNGTNFLLLIRQSFGWLAALYLGLLQAVLFIAL
jgi:hypothetical protein